MRARRETPIDDGGPGDVLFEHAKPNGDVFRAAKRSYRGSRPFLDLRLWVDGGRTATRQGATVPLEALPALAEALAAHAQPLNRPATPSRVPGPLEGVRLARAPSFGARNLETCDKARTAHHCRATARAPTL